MYQHIYTYDAVRHEFCGLTRTGSDEGLCIFSPVVLGDQAGVVRGGKAIAIGCLCVTIVAGSTPVTYQVY